MAWSFRKRIKIAPGVNINVSKSGVSSSVGPKGAKINVGPKGTKVYTSIPGAGIYYRGTLSKTDNEKTASSKHSSSSVDSGGEGSIFYGCLGDFGCFFLWGVILFTSFFLYDGIKHASLKWWLFTLLSSIIIGALILLWNYNGGNLRTQPSRRRFKIIVWVSFAAVLLLSLITFSNKKKLNEGLGETIIETAGNSEELVNDNEATIHLDDTIINEETMVEPEKGGMYSDLFIGCLISLSLIVLVIVFTYVRFYRIKTDSHLQTKPSN